MRKSLLGKELRYKFSISKQEVNSRLNRLPKSFNYSPENHISTLSNGATVFSQKMNGGVSTISVFSRCGSRYESPATSGVSHFLEHLNFKGTPRRTKLDIERGTEDMGGNLNAYTTRDSTSFIISVLDNKFSEGLDLVADMVTNSNYHQKDVEVEKGTIHAEVLNCHNDHWNTLAETSHFVSFRNNVIGLPILGLVENIPKMSSEMVKQYHRDNYHGDNVQIVCAGGVDHKEIVALCERSFKNLPKTPAHRKNYEPAPAIFTPGRMWIVQPSQGDRVYSILNMQGPGYTSPDYLGFMLLNNIIGESDLSAGFLSSLPKAEAFKAVGPKVNLLRNFSKYKACYLPYHEVGLFTLFLDSPVEDAGSAERLLKAYLQDLLFNISEEDVDRAFTKTINMMLEQDATYDTTQEIGNQLVYLGKKYPPLTWAHMLAEFSSVELMKYLVKKYFLNRPHAFCQWGDIEKFVPTKFKTGDQVISEEKASDKAKNGRFFL